MEKRTENDLWFVVREDETFCFIIVGYITDLDSSNVALFGLSRELKDPWTQHGTVVEDL